MLTEMLLQPPKNWQHLEPHPLAALFEFGSGIDIPGLVAHMRQYGYDDTEAIIIFEGFILDGRHRLIAAQEAGVVPLFRVFVGKDPLAFVVKKLHRQHLTVSQRAMYAAKIANLQKGSNQHSGIQLSSPVSQAKAAETVKVSVDSVKKAQSIYDEGTIQLQQAVKEGTVSLSDAAAATSASVKEQKAAVKNVRSGKAKTLKAALALREPGEEDAATDPPAKDKLGADLPEGLVAAFADMDKFKAIEALSKHLEAAVNELAHSPGGKRLRRYLTRGDKEKSNWLTSDYLVKFKRLLRDCKPFCVCPDCGAGEVAEACKRCAGSGWITQVQHKHGKPEKEEHFR